MYAVGKIRDIYAGTAFTKAEPTKSNEDGMAKTFEFYQELCQMHGRGLVYTNLVDFDMKFGHRRDAEGYGASLVEFDTQLKTLTKIIDEDTVIVLTADHGCDPKFTGTDHTREYVPLIVYGANVRPNQTEELISYPSFADLGATIADYFEVNYSGAGTTFAKTIFQD